MKTSQTVFSLQSGHECMVEMVMFNVPKAIIPKVGKPEWIPVKWYQISWVTSWIFIKLFHKER